MRFDQHVKYWLTKSKTIQAYIASVNVNEINLHIVQ